MDCSVFDFNSGVVQRENISHFSYEVGAIKKRIFFEQENPNGANNFGFNDISLTDSYSNDVVKNHEILENPLGMYYASCKHLNSADPKQGDICGWEKPGDKSCYGKFSTLDWLQNKENPVSLGPLASLPLGYDGDLSMNSLLPYDPVMPEEKIVTYMIGTSTNWGNGIWQTAPPRRYSAFWNLENALDSGNRLEVQNLFSGDYSNTIGIYADEPSPPQSQLNFVEFFKYSDKAASDEYLDNVFLSQTSSVPTNFYYNQKYSFKRRFNGEHAIAKYNKLNWGTADIENLCGGNGCRNVIVTGDKNKCLNPATGVTDTEIYCFPSPNIRVFKDNDSFSDLSNLSYIFSFDGYDNISFEDISLEIYPSPKFIHLFNWVSEREDEDFSQSPITRSEHYNLTAKEIFTTYIAPGFSGRVDVHLREINNIGDYYEFDHLKAKGSVTDYKIQPDVLNAADVSPKHSLIVWELIFLRGSQYGHRVFDNYFETGPKVNGYPEITGVYCNGDKTDQSSYVPLGSHVNVGDLLPMGRAFLGTLISNCEHKFVTSGVSDFNIRTNGFWYNFAKSLYEEHVLDKELFQIGTIVKVTDSFNFTMSNVRIKSMVVENFVDSRAKYSSFHGVKFEE